jgi:Na+/H+-translocating membrane pyrophosphatase
MHYVKRKALIILIWIRHVIYNIVTFQQTAKINQGNTALKRVVESIANGDSHVPFRDSKLTMLLQVHYS